MKSSILTFLVCGSLTLSVLSLPTETLCAQSNVSKTVEAKKEHVEKDKDKSGKVHNAKKDKKDKKGKKHKKHHKKHQKENGVKTSKKKSGKEVKTDAASKAKPATKDRDLKGKPAQTESLPQK